MDMPDDTRKAIWTFWGCIGTAVIAALLDRLSQRMGTGEFTFNLVLYGVAVIIPFKLAARSNATRTILCVLAAITLLAWVGGAASMPTALFSKIIGWLQLPAIGLTIFWLFTPKSNDWFNDSRNATADRLGGSEGSTTSRSGHVDRIEPSFDKQPAEDGFKTHDQNRV